MLFKVGQGLYIRQIIGSYSNIGLDINKVSGLLMGAGFDYVQS